MLRVQGIAARSFWFDEAFSWRIITFPVVEMIGRVARDNHPPLYFLLLKAWAAVFGISEVALRSLSLLFATVTVVIAASVAREVVRARRGGPEAEPTGRAAGLIAAALVTVSVVQIRWAWETRMYSLGTALAAATSWAMLRALRTKTVGGWAGYGALALLFAYSHYYALFSLAAQATYVAGSILKESRWRPGRAVAAPAFWHALLAAAIVAAGWLPWLPVFLAQRNQVKDHYWTHSIKYNDISHGMYQLFLAPENGTIDPGEAQAATALAALSVLALLTCRPRGGEVYLALAAILPLAFPIALSHLGTDVFHSRFLLFAHLHLLIGVGVLIGRLQRAPVRLAMAALLVVNGLAIDVIYWNQMKIGEKPGMRAAMAWVNSERRPGEPVVVSMSLIHSPVIYYIADPRHCYLFDSGRPILHYQGAQIILPGEMADDVMMAKFATGRIWTIGMRGGGWGSHYVPDLAGWKRVAERTFPEVYDVQGEIVTTLYEVAPSDRE